MRIVISGTVGVGKSTTTSILVKKLEEKGFKVNHLKEETIASPYLAHYYKSPEKWAFISQMDFLFERFKQWLIDEKKRKSEDNDKTITIYERHFIDDYIFAELHSINKNISPVHSVVYQAIYKELLDKLIESDTKPDYLFLLEADFSTIMNRLTASNKISEKEAADEYWKELYDSYYTKVKFKYHFNKYVKNLQVVDTENISPEEIAEEIIKRIGI